MDELRLSPLGHTWVLDLDGTLLKHNGHKAPEGDCFLPGAQEFLSGLPEGDMIVFITSREEQYRDVTERFLRENGVRWDFIVFDAPFGERILINDKKPSGLETAVAVSLKRDEGSFPAIVIDEGK